MLDSKMLVTMIERQKQHQRNLANTEGRAVQENEGSEIANVVDDLASDIGDLGVKLEELRERLAPIRIVGEEVEKLGYASPGYGSELGEKLGQLLAKEKALCALVDSLLHELAI